MRRRAVPRRWPASVRAAALRVVVTSLVTALFTALGIASAAALGVARASVPDSPGVRAPAGLSATTGSGPLAVPGAHLRGSPPGVAALAAEQDDSEVPGLTPLSADVPHSAGAVAPTVPGARAATGELRAPSGVMSTVHGRAPPA